MTEEKGYTYNETERRCWDGSRPAQKRRARQTCVSGEGKKRLTLLKLKGVPPVTFNRVEPSVGFGVRNLLFVGDPKNDSEQEASTRG